MCLAQAVDKTQGPDFSLRWRRRNRRVNHPMTRVTFSDVTIQLDEQSDCDMNCVSIAMNHRRTCYFLVNHIQSTERLSTWRGSGGRERNFSLLYLLPQRDELNRLTVTVSAS